MLIEVMEGGYQAGSNTAKVNAALSKEPKTMKQLMKESGLKGTYYHYLNNLIEAGHVKKSEKGYSLK